jgi:hypothetical protein
VTGYNVSLGHGVPPHVLGIPPRPIQRTLREGPFKSEHKCVLDKLSQPLTEVAMLSAAVGRTALTGATSAFQSVRLPAIAIDRRGHVLDADSGARRFR